MAELTAPFPYFGKCPRATANRRGRDQRTGWRPLI